MPAVEDSTNGTLTSLDPARDTLLELFAAAINSELGAAWTAVTDTLPAGHKLSGTSPVQDTVPSAPSEQLLTQRKHGWPVLMLHRDGRGEFSDHGLELDKLTQPWKLYWIVGPLDIIDQRKILDIGQAIAKVLRLVIRKRGHRAYQNGALQFFDDTTPLSSVELNSYMGPAHAGFAGESSTVQFWALEVTLTTTEISADLEGSSGSDIEAIDLTLGVGGEEEIMPALVLGQSDAEPPDPGEGAEHTTPAVSLWVMDFKTAPNARVYGFRSPRITLSDTDALPADVVLNTSEFAGPDADHRRVDGLGIDSNGALWMAQSRGGNRVPLKLYRIPAAQSLNSGSPVPDAVYTISNAGLDVITNIDFAANGDILLTGQNQLALVTAAQLVAGESAPSLVITTPNVAGYWVEQLGAMFDSAGNVWSASYPSPTGYVTKLSGAQVAAGGVQTPSVVWTGSNFAGPTHAIEGPDGRIWVSDYNDSAVKAFNASAPSGNPAPEITITAAGMTPESLQFDADGYLYVGSYDDATVYKFAPASLTTSGAKTPDLKLTAAGQMSGLIHIRLAQ